jgi:uncharacterized protein YqjF (DUF2071 family)
MAALQVERSAPLRPTLDRWVWSQLWRDVLFLHWRVPLGFLRALVPADLVIDEFRGETWVSLVWFRLKIRPRWLPYLPGFSALVEANLRTYVRYQGRPGIWFLSVHADNAFAIRLARWLTPIPYAQAQMTYRRSETESQLEMRSVVTPRCGLTARMRLGPELGKPAEDARAAWLLERYRLYVGNGARGLGYGDVSHPPWIARSVDIAMSRNTVGAALGLDLARPPDLSHFSPGVSAKFGTFHPVCAPR